MKQKITEKKEERKKEKKLTFFLMKKLLFYLKKLIIIILLRNLAFIRLLCFFIFLYWPIDLYTYLLVVEFGRPKKIIFLAISML